MCRYIVKNNNKTTKQQQNKIIYYSKYPYETCAEDYIVGDTEKRIEERTIDHNKRDKHLHILNQSGDKNHQNVLENYFRVLGNNYRSIFTRKISEC